MCGKGNSEELSIRILWNIISPKRRRKTRDYKFLENLKSDHQSTDEFSSKAMLLTFPFPFVHEPEGHRHLFLHVVMEVKDDKKR